MNPRFPLLSVIAMVMRVVGWLYLLPGLLFWLLVIINYFTHSGAGVGLLFVGIATFATIFGLFLVAAGESIGVFFAVEDNTRAAAEHLRKLADEKIASKTQPSDEASGPASK